MLGRGAAARQEVGDERAARGRRERPARLADIRDGREAAGTLEAEPGASGLKVPPAEHARRFGPPRGARRRPRVLLVAIRGDDQRIARCGTERDDDEAHAPMLPGRRERLDVPASLEQETPGT